MERAEAEAIYDAGREACVQFILDLAARVEQHDDRLKRLEEQARQDSRTSSKPPSQDPPKTRAQRRAEARAKAKELMRREGGEQRQAGGQPGHRGAGRELKPEDQVDEIVDHYPDACGGCGREFTDRAAPTEATVRSPPGLRAAADQRDLGRASHASVALSGAAWHGPAPGCRRRSLLPRSGRGCRRRS